MSTACISSQGNCRMTETFRIQLTGHEMSAKTREEIWQILCQCDHDFYPPLSDRESSAQKDLNHPARSNTEGAIKPYKYYNELIQQDFITAAHGGTVIGFLSFRPSYICDALKDFGRSAYATTMCVLPQWRGNHLMPRMYDCLEYSLPQLYGIHALSTRTWSLNHLHISYLKKRHFQEIAVLKDDRGPGIDTIYFGKYL